MCTISPTAVAAKTRMKIANAISVAIWVGV
jgi:hypothetical protein